MATAAGHACVLVVLTPGAQGTLNVPCQCNETIAELTRGIRAHFTAYVKGLSDGALSQAQLGLAHSYSRSKVKFNVNRADNMIIQAICILDQLDKDVNTFAMRVREWYSWHFPELANIVKDNYMYARVVHSVKSRSGLSEASLPGLTEIVLDADVAAKILEASRASMGMDVSEIDMVNIEHFAQRLVKLAEYRKQLQGYLASKVRPRDPARVPRRFISSRSMRAQMSAVAPNLSALIGDVVGARLISHAGSLTNLAKCPASTIQILGAEKALFRALKTKGNTPKYGLIFHSKFIGRAAAKDKGRISRCAAPGRG